MIIHAYNNNDLQSILEMHSSAILFFHAPWCGACKALEPILYDVADVMYKEQITLVEIDIDEYPDIANDENISTLPVFLMYKNEEQIDRRDGVMTKYELQKWIEGNLL